MVERDTTAEAAEVQMAVFRRMSADRRVRMVYEMTAQAFAATAAGIRSRHPDYSDEQVEWTLKRIRVGDDLFRAAWPHAPVLDP